MKSAWASRLEKARQIRAWARREDPDGNVHGRYGAMRKNGLTLEQCATRLGMTPRDLRQLIARVVKRSCT
jgi:hypothetical protein